jgi:ELWxxDGT repeat protein
MKGTTHRALHFWTAPALHFSTDVYMDPLRSSWVADTGDPTTFTATATDAAGDPLLFSLAPGAPTGAGIDPTTGTFSWTPTPTQTPGVYTVGIRATDANNANFLDEEDVQISVIKRTATLVTDINGFGQGSSPTSLVNVNGTVFFVATVPAIGTGLYKSDGTPGGTVLVKNFSDKLGTGAFGELTASGNLVFFTYELTDVDGTLERQLWRSDGTAIGTFWLKDLNLVVNFNDPTFPYYPSHLTDVNGTLFFLDYDYGIYTASQPSGLWKSDGTVAGTMLVQQQDWYANTILGYPELVNVNGTLFFTAWSDVTLSMILWESDGTSAGTQVVAAVSPDNDLTNVNGTLFFSGGGQLWKSNGTDTVQITDSTILPNATFSNLTNVNGTLYFAANGLYTDPNTGLQYDTGIELWKSDGTAAGTVLVKDINTQSNPNTGGTMDSSPANLINVNGILYFTATDGNQPLELWKSNGTANGTIKIKDMDGGVHLPPPYPLLTAVNGTVFFASLKMAVNEDGYHLWKTQGTPSTTVEVDPSGAAGPAWLTTVGADVLFVAYDAVHGPELWISDGTATGTQLVKRLSTATVSSSPSELTVLNGSLIFAADDGAHYPQVWKTNGTALGTTMLSDNSYSSFDGLGPHNLTVCGGVVYFAAFTYDPTTGYYADALWKTDGTAAGTVLVKEVVPQELVNFNGTLFFAGSDPANGSELWKTDGTTAGTVLVKDINPGAADSSPHDFTVVNGTLFFAANDGVDGTALWKTDGTAAGTVMVSASSADPQDLMSVGGTLFFSATTVTYGRELWKSDGTNAGTVLVDDINPGSADAAPSNLTALNGMVYFFAASTTSGTGLWESDGTANGTVLVEPFASVSNMANINGNLYFAGDDGSSGAELWKSDGTQAGTALVADINPGPDGSNPSAVVQVNGSVFFAADDGTNGNELWKTDGTGANTVLVKDIFPGDGSSNPSNLINFKNRLFFAADDAAHGVELWQAVNPPPGDEPPGANSESVTTNENVAYTGKVTGSDPDGDPLTFFLTTPPANGTVTMNADGTFTYMPSAGYRGPDSFTFQCADPYQDSDPATVAVTVNPVISAASSLAVTGLPTSAMAGAAQTFTVTALNPDGSTATSYQGTVHFTSSDLQAGLPADYTFQPGDLGKRTFTATLRTSGNQTITATDVGNSQITGSGAVPVTAAAARRFLVTTAASTVTAGNPLSITVTALDPYNNVATGYTGTIHFSTSAKSSVLPANYMFISNNQGVHAFSVTLKTAGNQSVSVADTVTKTLTGQTSVTSEFPTLAGGSNPQGITAGPDGNLWFTDPGANQVGFITPWGSITEFSLPNAGSQPTGIIAGPDGNLWFTETGHNAIGRITPSGGLTEFPVPTPGSKPFGITTGPDGNLWFTEMAANKVGKITPAGAITQFTLATGSAPEGITTGPDHNLWFAESGTSKIGRLTPTGTLTQFSLASGSGPAMITTGSNGKLWFTESVANKIGAMTTTGTASLYTVPTATSQPEGIVAGPDGSLWFTEAQGNLIGRVTTTGAFTEFAIFTVNSQPVSIATGPDGNLWFTEAAAGKVARLVPAVVVNPGPLKALKVSGFPTSTVAGVPNAVTVTAVDAYGNTVPTYRGTVHFASSDTQAVLPANYTFTAADGGTHTFINGVTLKTAGTRTIVATDTVTKTLTAKESVKVSAAAVTHLVVAGFPTTATHGTAYSFTVTAKDAYGNTVTGYTGTVTISSTDTKATFTLTASNAGVYTYSGTLNTVGTQSITATDTAGDTGSETGIQVVSAAPDPLPQEGRDDADEADGLFEPKARGTLADQPAWLFEGGSAPAPVKSEDLTAGLLEALAWERSNQRADGWGIRSRALAANFSESPRGVLAIEDSLSGPDAELLAGALVAAWGFAAVVPLPGPEPRKRLLR